MMTSPEPIDSTATRVEDADRRAPAVQSKPQPLAVTSGDAPANVLAAILRVASDPSTDIEKMERLMAMHERMRVQQAEQAFNDAMSAAQADMPRIEADRHNSQTKSDYASYGQLDRVVRPIYTRNGFALSFNTEASAHEGMVRVVCYASHRDGFTRTYAIDMPADGKGAKGGDVMTKTHATGSATAYGQRYLLKLIFNLAIGFDPDDDDGNGAGEEQVEENSDRDWINRAQALRSLPDYDALRAKMLAHYGAVQKIPADVRSAFNRAKGELSAMQQQGAQP